MLTIQPNSAAEKRDLHVGELGLQPMSPLAAIIDPNVGYSIDWVQTARHAARRAGAAADSYIRERPWAALGLVALLGATAGLLLARRS